MNKHTSFIPLACAAIAGVAIGMLVAPKSGEDTRKKISETTASMKKKAQQKADMAKNKRHGSDTSEPSGQQFPGAMESPRDYPERELP